MTRRACRSDTAPPSVAAAADRTPLPWCHTPPRQGRVHWLAPFLRKLRAGARLVAPTFSCAQTRPPPAARGGGAGVPRAAGAARQVPHPELGFVVVDGEALGALLALDGGQGGGSGEGAVPPAAAPGVTSWRQWRRLAAAAGEPRAPASLDALAASGVFGCYASGAAAEHHAAAAAAEALLARGWALDTLMLVCLGGVGWGVHRSHVAFWQALNHLTPTPCTPARTSALPGHRLARPRPLALQRRVCSRALPTAVHQYRALPLQPAPPPPWPGRAPASSLPRACQSPPPLSHPPLRPAASAPRGSGCTTGSPSTPWRRCSCPAAATCSRAAAALRRARRSSRRGPRWGRGRRPHWAACLIVTIAAPGRC
jgi:hypothetical protein